MKLKPADINVSKVGVFMGSEWQNTETELIARNVVLTQQMTNPNEWTPFTWEQYVERCTHLPVTEREHGVLDALVSGGKPVWNTSAYLQPGFLTKDAEGRYAVTDKFLKAVSTKSAIAH